MSRITVIGGTGYAGSAIVREAASRGHEVTAFSRSAPSAPTPGVTYVQGAADDPAALESVIGGAEVVVAALSPRGELVGKLRPIYRQLIQLADAAGAKLVVVGGFSALRPVADAPRFMEGEIPEQFRAEALETGGVITEDLPAAPESLDWIYVSPAGEFGAFAPGEKLGRYRLGGEVALFDENGTSALSGADYAAAVVDLIQRDEHHREQLGVAY